MDRLTEKKPKTWPWVLGTMFAPVLVMSVAICITRQLSVNGSGWDDGGLALSVAAGLCFLWRLPSGTSILSRAWLVALYVPAVAGLLVIYSLVFVSVVFGHSL